MWNYPFNSSSGSVCILPDPSFLLSEGPSSHSSLTWLLCPGESDWQKAGQLVPAKVTVGLQFTENCLWDRPMTGARIPRPSLVMDWKLAMGLALWRELRSCHQPWNQRKLFYVWEDTDWNRRDFLKTILHCQKMDLISQTPESPHSYREQAWNSNPLKRSPVVAEQTEQ